MNCIPQIIHLEDGTRCVSLEDYDKLATEHMLSINKLFNERDEALIELQEYRSIAENIGAKKAVSEKEKAIQERDELREELKEETKFHHRTHSELVKTACELMNARMERDDLREILSAISLYLSVGMGDETTTAKQYHDRILEGIKMLTDPLQNRIKELEEKIK